jgi:hypothetical protein
VKDALPDLSWMKDYMPEETVNNLSKHLSDLANSVSLPDTVRRKHFNDCYTHFILSTD